MDILSVLSIHLCLGMFGRYSVFASPFKLDKLRESLHEQHRNAENKDNEGNIGYLMDHPKDIDADSNVENLFESFAVEDNGYVHMPEGQKHQEKSKFKGDENDVHLGQFDSYVDRKRNYRLQEKFYWPDGIVPYVIADGFSEDHKKKINHAIQVFNNATCVKWIPSDHANVNHDSYVIFKAGKHCSSYVGMMTYEKYKPQKINLGGSCFGLVTIIHEMLHTIGAIHEVKRPDADNYVTVEWNNIIDGSKANFGSLKDVNIVNPYDVSSILQYDIYAFSKNGDKTLRLKDWRLEFLVDSATGFMHYDIAEVNKVYKCTEHCGNNVCENGGFYNPDCTCRCPDELTGPFCNVPVTDVSCGGVIKLNGGEKVTITSPNYPNYYDVGLICTWLIKGVHESVVRAIVNDMKLGNNGNACYHWLEFRYNLLGQTGPRRCGTTKNELWDSTLDELSDTMIVRFDSKTESEKPPTKGFSITFQSIGRGCADNPCKFGTCHSSVITNDFTCACYEGFTGNRCQELTENAAVGCSAEVGQYCMLKQNKTDDFDWHTRSGHGPLYYVGKFKAVTGPPKAKEGFVYLFTQSDRRRKHDSAILFTDPDLHFPKIERCLSFWYHMRSILPLEMGTLNVYMSDSSGAEELIFTKSHNQGKLWLQEKIDVKAVDGLKIIFEGVIHGWLSDMAIDDVWLTPGTCDK